MEDKKEILKICMSKGFLLDKEMLDLLGNLNGEGVKDIVEALGGLDLKERVINKNLFVKYFEKIKRILISSNSFGEKKGVVEEFFIAMGYTRKEFNLESGVGEEEVEEENGEEVGKVKLLSAPAFVQRKISVKDFVNHFRSRYEMMKSFLEGRGIDNLRALRKVGNERESFNVIVAVLNKRITKNKNLILDVEDLSGVGKILVSSNKKEVFDKAKDVLVDDVVAFSVTSSGGGNFGGMLFANDVIFPEAALQEKRFSDFDENVVFISDVHAGSSMFLEENFLKFIKWVNGQEGDERQKEVARKVKYIFINGDGVDGVGHFPGQDRVLNIGEIKGQYRKLAELLKLIRKDVKIIFSSGNHDAVWVGEPQPIVGEDWAPDLYKIENLTLVPNPSVVEVDGGFKILVYHGFGAHGFVNEIEDIRLNYGHDSPARIFKEALKRRHLSPMHGYSDYIPCEKDGLTINIVPDILTTADLHRSDVSMYNNILLIATSCWQSMTPFQEKVGNNPDFCKVPVFNLKTRELKILDFYSEKTEEKEVCWDEGEGLVCEIDGEGKKEIVGVKNG